MLFCRVLRLSVAQRFNSTCGVQVQVKAKRLKGDVTCALHNKNSFCNTKLHSEYDGKHFNLFKSRGGRRTVDNVLLSVRSRGSSRSVQAAPLGQLTEWTLRNTQFVPILPTSAQSSYHRILRNAGSPLFWESAGDTENKRFSRLGAIEPILFTSGAGRFLLAFPTTNVQMRPTSTAAAQKRDPGPEDTAAKLKEDQPSSGAPSDVPQEPGSEDQKPSKTQQLKKVFKEYGAVGVTFHIGISLMSLGMFYLAISSGIDMAAVLYKLGFSETVVRSKMAAGTSTFVLAYAVHKLFAPVRISITLVSVPLIVRYFRKTGLFKPPASTP
ncbi:hypothetical protein MATL_G00078200 [Megalops atlanticus]|uniref:DUF1279 domain-containing protein n=1 Tax=Megalops atlanticus TaxID=7932 RepID=A0A9D3T8M8_MEGAT|nr:hypothetical protein MATL_G00078200 [Megalops atlanticus]